MIEISIKDNMTQSKLWFHFDSYQEAFPTIVSAKVISGYTVEIEKVVREEE